MTTSVTVNLSPTLSATLNHSGVNAYAVYFETSGTTPGQPDSVHAFQIASGGVVNSSIDFEMPSPYSGGKVYFIIQSVASGGLTFGPGGDITQESDISWNSAQQDDFRYDSFEVSLESNAGDEGNLTEINGFGIPMEVSIAYQDGSPPQSRGYDLNGADIFQRIQGVNANLVAYPYSSGPLAGSPSPRMALSPTEAEQLHLPGANYTDWAGYVTSLEQVASGTIQITGYYNGAFSKDAFTIGPNTYLNQVYHNGGFYSYDLSYDATNNFFLLTPEANSEIKGTIEITPQALENSIYSTIGNANILDGTSATSPVFLANMNTGANTEWGAAFVKLLTGFTAGYLGGTADPLNPLLGSGTLDLSKDWNFDPTYAFGGTAGGPGVSTSPNVFFDHCAEIFFLDSNAYGNGYSDNLTNAFTQGGPLISVANGSGPTSGTDVNNINITLFDDNEPNPATAQGYTIPILNNVNHGPYVAPQASMGPGLTLTLPFGVGQFALGDNVSASLGFYRGIADGLAQFETVTFAVSSGGTLYQTWDYVPGGGSANGTVVSSGIEIISGTAGNTSVTAGGSAVVSSGGTANLTSIGSGGHELVMSGGIVSGATISSGGILEIASGAGVASSTIGFANGSGGELVLDDTKFRGEIAGFTGSGSTIADSDAIDLTTVASATATLAYTGNTLSGTLTVTDGTHTAKLAMLGNFAASDFNLTNDGGGHTLITYSATPLHPGG